MSKFHELRSTLELTTAPTIEPVTVADLKTHSRIDFPEEDAVLGEYLKAARGKFERDTLRGLLTQTWKLRMDRFPCDHIELRKNPVASVSVAYVDGDGTSQTWSSSDYILDTGSEPARITPAYGEVWPTTRAQANAVTVTFVVGWTTSLLVPAEAKQAIRLLAAHWAKSREAVGDEGAAVPLSYQDLVDAMSWAGYR